MPPPSLRLPILLLGTALLGFLACQHPVDVSPTPEERASFKIVQPVLSVRPIRPVHPVSAKGTYGRVVTEVVVGKDGLPAQVRAVSGPESLREATLAWAGNLRFTPGTVKGRAQLFRMKVSILWIPEGATYEIVMPKSAADWN